MDARSAQAETPSQHRGNGSGEHLFADAATATELLVQQIWEEVLNRKGLSRTEDFFDLGGTSLDLIRVFARVKDKFNLNLDGSLLEEEATIARLAKCIDAERVGQSMR